MNENNTDNNVVDGFSDNLQSADAPEVDAADRGTSSQAAKPLSPEEYEKLQEDARENKPSDGHPEALKNKE